MIYIKVHYNIITLIPSYSEKIIGKLKSYNEYELHISDIVSGWAG